VLEFARALERKQLKGMHGKSLLPFAGTIPLADLEAMTQAIEAGCEQVDENEW